LVTRFFLVSNIESDVQLQAVKQPLPDICGLWPDSHKQAHPMPIDPFTGEQSHDDEQLDIAE